MNNKERLLADTLGEADSELFALVAAARARRRRVGRQTGLVAGLGLAAGIAFLLAHQPRKEVVIAATSPGPVLEIISDQELMAQLKDQPVLYFKDQNRITGVVFLETKENESAL